MHQLAAEITQAQSPSDEVVMVADGAYSAMFGEHTLTTAYQPIFKVTRSRKGRPFGYEGLLRSKPEASRFVPSVFFSALTDSDRYRLDRLSQELHIKNWVVKSDPDACLFINMEACCLGQNAMNTRGIALAVSKARLWGIDPEKLVLEVTESDAASQKALVYFVDSLRECGVRIAVDDFGVDSSNIERVRALRPDFVKLDGRFFHRFAANGRLLPMLKGLVNRLRDLDSEVIAEMIETEHQLDTALECDIELMQGYFLSRPELVS